MRTAAAYRDELLALLPLGQAWPRDPAATTGMLLLALADEFSRIDGRADDLLEEADPGTTLELLPDWERVAGLPDPCVRAPVSVAERRLAVVGRIADRGGQSIPYFVEFAARYGYAIEIEECTSSDCGFDCGMALGDDGWRFVWFVHVILAAEVFAAGLSFFTAGISVAGDYLSTFGAFDLECLFARAKPAHTIVHFAYDTGD